MCDCGVCERWTEDGFGSWDCAYFGAWERDIPNPEGKAIGGRREERAIYLVPGASWGRQKRVAALLVT